MALAALAYLHGTRLVLSVVPPDLCWPWHYVTIQPPPQLRKRKTIYASIRYDYSI